MRRFASVVGWSLALLLAGFATPATAAQADQQVRAAITLTIANCLERIGQDNDAADRFRQQTGVFRIEKRAAPNEDQFSLQGTGQLVDVQPNAGLFLTSAHTFRTLLRERRTDALTSTIQGVDADGTPVNYTVYLFVNELAATDFRMWRPLVAACSSSSPPVYQGDETLQFKIARLVRIDPQNREVTIVGVSALDEAVTRALREILNERRPIADLYDFALLRSADWRNPQGVQAIGFGARMPNSPAGGGSAGIFYGYGHRDASGRPVHRNLQGAVLEAAARPQYDASSGGSFGGDSGALVVATVNGVNMGVGLVSRTRARGSGACAIEGDFVSLQSGSGRLLLAREGGEEVELDAQCLTALQSGVELSPLAYLSAPPFLFFFDPFRRNPDWQIETVNQAALANDRTQQFQSFSRAPTLPDSIRLHAAYQKYRPSELYQRFVVASNQRYWSDAAYNRLGYGRWRDEVLDDYERASRELSSQAQQITPAIAQVAVRDAERISADACDGELQAGERDTCRDRANRAQFAAMELATVAASQGRGVNAREGADIAVRFDDLRRHNPELAARSVLADDEVRDVALSLDRNAVFRREGNVSETTYTERLRRFDAQVSEQASIERRNNREVYVIDRAERPDVEVPVREFRERIRRESE